MDLRLALVAFAAFRTPTGILKAMASNPNALEVAWNEASATVRDRLEAEAVDMRARGVAAVNHLEAEFPLSLNSPDLPPVPVLFYIGDIALASQPGIGMCGSRSVSALGLKAAGSCGVEVSEHGMVVISGYARGVDTETHLAALRTGGKTVIVLAEGINHFRVKRAFAADFDAKRTLVVSQFAPTQPWQAHAAMTRNAIIFGLGSALVVIEAGERGGTLAAGNGALKLGRPVLVLNFGPETPRGNEILLSRGGRKVASRAELGRALDELAPKPRPTTFEQGHLAIE